MTLATAAQIAASLHDGSGGAEEAVADCFARIAEVNPALNCWCDLYEEEALDEARRIDALPAAEKAALPLAGVPFAVKDLTPLKGKRTTLGSLVYKDNVGTFDPLYVQRLRAAGAIVAGKVTTPEFAHAGSCNSPLLGVTRNPWDLSRTPGGSSGGSGAAVASGSVPLAEGTDMAGSIRIPAAACGIYGLKPSLGRIPMDILPSVFDNVSHFGPLARTVEDIWLFLSAAAGPDDADPLSLMAQEIAFDPDAEVTGLRAALTPDLGFHEVDPAIVENLHAAAEALEGQGVTVEEIDLGWSVEVADAIAMSWDTFIGAFFGHLLETSRAELDVGVVEMMERAETYKALDYKRIEILRTRLWRDLLKVFSSFDVLLCPTLAMIPPPAEESDRDWWQITPEGRLKNFDMTGAFSFTPHCPILSAPSGLAPDGLPTGVQVIGPRFAEALVLRVGRALERADLLRGAAPSAV